MHPRNPLAFLAVRAHCWLMVNLSSTRTPRSLSSELLSSRSALTLYWCMGLFLPRCRTLHLPLLNTTPNTHTAIHSKLHQTWKANLIHSFPSVALYDKYSAAFLVYWLFSWHALFLPLACLLLSNDLFLPVTSEVSLSNSALVVCVVFSLVEILRLFFTSVSFLFPPSLTLFIFPLSPPSLTHHWFQFEKGMHKIAWPPIFCSWILPEMASRSITFGKQCCNSIFLRFFFFCLCYLQKSETCTKLMLPWCCLRLGLASSQGRVWVALFLKFKGALLTFISLMVISNEWRRTTKPSNRFHWAGVSPTSALCTWCLDKHSYIQHWYIPMLTLSF